MLCACARRAQRGTAPPGRAPPIAWRGGALATQEPGTDDAAAIRLVHGNADRATSFHGTEKLFERLPNADKQLEIYDGYEHGAWVV